jgi:uncharacterized protein (TIGR03118 family)
MTGPSPRLARRARRAALVAGAGLLAAAPAAAAKGNSYHRTDLISDQPGQALLTDPDLVNAWGLAAGDTPLWVADNGTDKATLYSNGGGTGMPAKLPLVVDVSGGAPTGQVFNATGGFGGATFLFSSETGKITAWSMSSGTTADVVAQRRRAVYKGLAITRSRLYATDFRHGRVDVWNSGFHRVSHPGFRDRRIPRSYAPFGIKAIGPRIYVSYAKQDAEGEDDVAGRGHGFVDAFSRSGHLRKRLVRHGKLDSPWGLVRAPAGFGSFSGDLLVGNFGDGLINAYSRRGKFRGTLRSPAHRRIRIQGLWDLRFGNGTFFGGRHDLVFSAGPGGEQHGLVGTISPR